MVSPVNSKKDLRKNTNPTQIPPEKSWKEATVANLIYYKVIITMISKPDNEIITKKN